MKLLVFLSIYFITTSAVSLEDAWSDFKKEYSKDYKSLREDKFRFEIFKSKLQMVNEHNIRYESGEESYSIEINKFSDLTDEEIQKFFGYKKPEIEFIGQFEPPLNYTAAASIDWRSKGAVLSVKDQRDCGSCYAFGAIACLEGQVAIKHNIKDDLSEQEIVDCSGEKFHNDGCKGGWETAVFQYIQANGVSTLKNYPYVGKVQGCKKASKSRARVKVTGYKEIAPTESALQAAVAKIGPISIGIAATKIVAYKSGIYDNVNCGKDPNHAVVAVGYGTENGKDYWLIKNSWGTNWGEKGYFKLIRNKNQCGVASEALYPVIS